MRGSYCAAYCMSFATKSPGRAVSASCRQGLWNLSFPLYPGQTQSVLLDRYDGKGALIRAGAGNGYIAHPGGLKNVFGWQLPYRTSRSVFAVGLLLKKNLEENWIVREKA